MKKRFFTNAVGFSLLEVMISAGLLSAVSLTLTAVTKYSSNGIKKMKETVDIASLKSIFNGIATDSGVCSQYLRISNNPITLSPGSKTAGISIYQPGTSTPFIKEGQLYDTEMVNSIYITLDSTSSAGLGSNSTRQIYQGVIGINLGSPSFDLTWPMTVILNSSNQIVQCGTILSGNGSVLGINSCSNNQLLKWDGVSFTCIKAICGAGEVQFGVNSDFSANCISVPTCSQHQVPVFRNGTFVCKQIFCSNNLFVSAVDSDGFISACNKNYICPSGKVMGSNGCQ